MHIEPKERSNCNVKTKYIMISTTRVMPYIEEPFRQKKCSKRVMGDIP